MSHPYGSPCKAMFSGDSRAKETLPAGFANSIKQGAEPLLITRTYRELSKMKVGWLLPDSTVADFLYSTSR
jgi:hypothetical protein